MDPAGYFSSAYLLVFCKKIHFLIFLPQPFIVGSCFRVCMFLQGAKFQNSTNALNISEDTESLNYCWKCKIMLKSISWSKEINRNSFWFFSWQENKANLSHFVSVAHLNVVEFFIIFLICHYIFWKSEFFFNIYLSLVNSNIAAVILFAFFLYLQDISLEYHLCLVLCCFYFFFIALVLPLM